MTSSGRTNYSLFLAAALTLTACAANPHLSAPSSSSTSLLASQYTSGMVNFDYNDFYTLTSPNTLGCAGDAMNYYNPLSGQLLASNGSTGTLLPSFIKNISVDMTDANSTAPTNRAYACSYGSSNTLSTSNCATFDYPEAGGVNSDLSGSVLLIGGVQGVNGTGINGGASPGGLAVSCGQIGTGYNSCSTSAWALGVDTLPASAATNPPNDLVPGLNSATSSITSWVNLASNATYSGPQNFVGAAGAYDTGDNELALFGGTSIISATNGEGQADSNDTTWIFNLGTQTWSKTTSSPAISQSLLETFEQDDIGTRELANQVTARAMFGYAAVQGLGVDSMSNSTTLSSYQYQAASMPLDYTDRIVITGGLLSASIVGSDSFVFNPTYGPAWVDTLGRYLDTSLGQSPSGAGLSVQAAAGEPVQWLQNYHTQPLFNTTPTGAARLAEFEPSPVATSSPVPILNFGIAPLRDNTNYTGSGYLLYMGGFDMTQTSTLRNPQLDSCASGGGSCGMMIERRTGRALGDAGGAGSGESYPSAYSSVGNLPFATITMANGPTGSSEASQSYSTTQLSPSYWDSYQGTASGVASSPTVPYYGGATLLPGFNLSTNDVVFFGGADCSNYLLSSASSNCTSFANPGVYFRMQDDPLAAGTAIPTGANRINLSGSPAAAGMAAARGVDSSGNPVIVAYGGMTAAGTSANGTIWFLYNAGTITTPTPTWGSYTPSGISPAPVTNGALVFSHVTKKFYLFGGYNPVSGDQSADTWELSMSGSCGTTSAGCAFSWRQLDVSGGLVCNPSCPSKRRSHRMVEVNYYNRNPGGSVGGVATGESTCGTTSPCSYSIFMEDGTPDGTNLISDRWIFDPTANDGWGAWQEMHEMPSRTLAAMASVDYSIPSTSTTAHRAILFGGETGFSDPSWASSTSGGTFVPPTLGDTWMYDYDTQVWNRVQILGKGYNGTPSSTFITDETSNRQAYDATNPANTDTRSSLAELSPPPTSGAMMVTRTYSGPQNANGTAAAALAIPEIYMIGGRLKDGSYQALDHVYKFCAGTTGEAYSTFNGTSWVPNTSDFTCDAYNATTNPSSPSPQTGYVGRWLRKTPGATNATANQLSSFMGAAAYDSTDDLIVVYGGLQFSGTSTPYYVTDPSTRSADTTNVSGLGFTVPIYEYTPPNSTVGAQGSWSVVGECAGQSSLPSPRYGHSMTYDPVHKQLIIVGGYNGSTSQTGMQLVDQVTVGSSSVPVPDTWTAQRVPVSGSPGTYCYNWTQVTTIGNSSSNAPPGSGLAHMIATYIPSTGYDTGYYSTYNDLCSNVGPDQSQPGVGAGGVYFDIDRSQLGANENLLLNLTFIPLGQSNNAPNSTAMTESDEAIFFIHLVHTGQSASQLQSLTQPRYLTYSDTTTYPEVVPKLAVVSEPSGQPRTEQILIPLNSNPNIDRIRIERNSGTAILVSASLFRMGQK